MLLHRNMLLLGAVLSVLLCFSLILPVKAEATMWTRTFGETTKEWAYCVVETSDGGYAIAGTRDHAGGDNDLWLVKTDAFGNVEWNKTYHGDFFLNVFSLIATSDGGYAVASHKEVFYNESDNIAPFDFWLIKTDAFGNMEWNKTYGGPEIDFAYSLVEGSDGGYAIAGTTRSFGDGETDSWLVKTDALGNMEWNRTYGGTGFDYAYSLVAASDGGYAIGGLTKSFGFEDEQLWLVKTDNYGNAEWNKTCGVGSVGIDRSCYLATTSDGGYALVEEIFSDDSHSDFLLVKTDPSGNVEWSQTYGGTETEKPNSLVTTSDGGCAIAGFTNSFGAGSHDCWLVKTDEFGNMEWNKTYGGIGYDVAESLVVTSDGGYIIAGERNDNFWLVKTDELGSMEWSQTYSGIKIDIARSVVETSDGGYAIVGGTSYSDAEEGGSWLIKTNSSGNVEWDFTDVGWSLDVGTAYGLVETNGSYAIAGHTGSVGAGDMDFWFWFVEEPTSFVINIYSQTYGGTETDIAYSLVETSDGGFAIVGFTYSFGAGEADFWLVKTDLLGSMQWNQTYGGTGTEKAHSLIATSDGGYAIAGFTETFGAGSGDFWLVKTDALGNMEWNKTYGGQAFDIAYSLVETSDGGYALTGFTESLGAGDADFWLIKTDESGNMAWNKTYGGPAVDIAYSLVETSDGGFALAGRTESFGNGSADFWLVKTDMFGNMEWTQTYGEDGDEGAQSLVESSDGGYAIAGYTNSFSDGYYDFWLVKTDEFGNIPEAEWVVLPLLMIATLSILVSKKKLHPHFRRH